MIQRAKLTATNELAVKNPSHSSQYWIQKIWNCILVESTREEHQQGSERDRQAGWGWWWGQINTRAVRVVIDTYMHRLHRWRASLRYIASSLVPRLSRGGGERAWYTPFAHALNYFTFLSLFTSSGLFDGRR